MCSECDDVRHNVKFDSNPRPRKHIKIKDKEAISVNPDVAGVNLGHKHLNFKLDAIPRQALKEVAQNPTGRNTPRPIEERVSLERDVVILDGSGYMIVHDSDKRPSFLKHGIIGTPVGQKTIDSTLEIDLTNKPFTLSSYDVNYAFEMGLISPNPTKGRKQTKFILRKWGEKHDTHFNEKYKIYKELRKNNLIVMDGLQYGVDFVVFKDSPEEFVNRKEKDHSFMMIQVVPNMDELSTKDVIKGRRLGKQIRKDYVVAQIAEGERVNGVLLPENETGGKMVLYRFNDKDKFGGPVIDTKNNLDALIIRRVGRNKDIPIVPYEIVDDFKSFDRRLNFE